MTNPPDQPESGPREWALGARRSISRRLDELTVPNEFMCVVRGPFVHSSAEIKVVEHSALVAAEEATRTYREQWRKAEARIAELEREIDGADGWRDSCAFFEKRAEAAERERDELRETLKHDVDKIEAQYAERLAHAQRERDENERLLTLALKCDRSTIELLQSANAENERLRAALEEIAVMDEQDEPYSAEIARKALERLVDGV